MAAAAIGMQVSDAWPSHSARSDVCARSAAMTKRSHFVFRSAVADLIVRVNRQGYERQ